MPPKSDRIAYGEYLTTAASCYDCHTKQEKGQYVGEPFAGGTEFLLPNNTVATSPNITPSKKALGNWTTEQFVARFKVYVDSAYVSPEVGEGDPHTPMPWTMYGGMTKEDLSAIFAYLQTVKAVDPSE